MDNSVREMVQNGPRGIYYNGDYERIGTGINHSNNYRNDG